jgi:hypothetical protein
MGEEFKSENYNLIKYDKINRYLSITYESSNNSNKASKIVIYIKNVPIITRSFIDINEKNQVKKNINAIYQKLKTDLVIWSKNDYKTTNLDYRIAFPLLKELRKVGETRFQIIFQQEILKEYIANKEEVKQFLTNKGYIKLIGDFF